MIHIILRVMIVGVFSCTAVATQAQNETNRFWLMWEQSRIDLAACLHDGLCNPQRSFITRLVEEPDFARAQSVFYELDRVSLARRQPPIHPDTPIVCPANFNQIEQPTTPQLQVYTDSPDYEKMEISDKLAPLKNLPGVYFKLDGVRGPTDDGGKFGQQLQGYVTDAMTKAGIPILTKEELENTPGKPQFSASFSGTQSNGCTWRVSAMLKQTVLLSRDLSVKLASTTWASFGGFDAAQPEQDEFDALTMLIDKFITDYKKVNEIAD
ncbi:hypothetical protein GCM10008927_26850 [Amylibacter ulvae]|uniref:Uncharacterized protein n=1 Tax=Paramylibacter ulvae TaxID=1651968 RepID=A0ABQ3D5I4_9RHOB|nr:hypothetical protein [Amylibacter ulvae]GHA59875.1 hypothetical protein GCM10008927_26850 [Amylibacter ulvae]